MRLYLIYFVLICIAGCTQNSVENVEITDHYPSDYISEDGNVNITFFKNGNLKQIIVTSGIYEEPYDSVTGGGGIMYITQAIVYNEDQTLRTVSINADSNATFWYSKEAEESICYNCDSVIVTAH